MNSPLPTHPPKPCHTSCRRPPSTTIAHSSQPSTQSPTSPRIDWRGRHRFVSLPSALQTGSRPEQDSGSHRQAGETQALVRGDRIVPQETRSRRFPRAFRSLASAELPGGGAWHSLFRCPALLPPPPCSVLRAAFPLGLDALAAPHLRPPPSPQLLASLVPLA